MTCTNKFLADHSMKKFTSNNIMEQKAKKFGASELGTSKTKSKRFYVVFKGKKINFGSKTGSTFIDHHDSKIKQAWRQRHSKIKNKNGEYVYKLKTSPSFWSWNLLW